MNREQAMRAMPVYHSHRASGSMNIDTTPCGHLDDPLGDIDERQMLIDKVADLEASRNDLAEALQSILHHAHWGRVKDGNELEDIYQLAAAALAKVSA